MEVLHLQTTDRQMGTSRRLLQTTADQVATSKPRLQTATAGHTADHLHHSSNTVVLHLHRLKRKLV